MGYDRLRARLEAGLDARDIVALPDGSVDRYYALRDTAGERIETRGDFAQRVASARSFQLEPDEIRPGGQAVNAAIQVDALGQSVTLYGHLDDPEMAGLPFRTVSMGVPATVHVFGFDREELMFSVESEDIREWTFADLLAVVDGPPDAWLDDDVLLLQNWAGFPAMTDSMTRLAELDTGSTTVVCDPGSIAETPAADLRGLVRGLSALGEATDVVLSANDAELDSLAAALDVTAEGTARERHVREALGIDAVVRHSEAEAVAAAGKVTTVENFDARTVVRRTGAGDRFDGGLSVGLAAGLDWELALALGNAVATYFVENGETATREAVRSLLDART